MANAFFAHGAAQIAGQGFGFFTQSRLHIDLQHKVHSASQIQAQVHGRGMQAAEPGGRARYEIERHHIRGIGRVWVERLGHCVFGLELHIGTSKTRLDGVTVQRYHFGADARRFKCLLHPRYRAQVQLERRLGH